MHGVSAMSLRVVRVGASLDTQQRLPYNRNAPRKIQDSFSYEQWLPSPPKVQKPSSPKMQKPSPPKVQKPRTVLNAAALAYLGDCTYEVPLVAASHFLQPSEVMVRLGFSADSSQLIPSEDANG